MTLDEIKKARAAITPGPYFIDKDHGVCYGTEGNPSDTFDLEDSTNFENDDIFRAKSPEYVDWLIADNKRLEERLEAAVKVISFYGDSKSWGKTIPKVDKPMELDGEYIMEALKDRGIMAGKFLQSLTPKLKDE